MESLKPSDDTYAFGYLDESLRAPLVGRLDWTLGMRRIEVWVGIRIVQRTPPFCLRIMPEVRKRRPDFAQSVTKRASMRAIGRYLGLFLSCGYTRSSFRA